MKLKYFVILAVVLVAQACAQTTTTTGTQDEEKATFAKEINVEGIQLIDVRTPQEYQAGHIEGAILIDFLSPNFLSEAKAKLDPKKPVYLYCKSGGRSGRAMQLLADQGFVKLTNLIGGYDGWKRQEK